MDETAAAKRVETDGIPRRVDEAIRRLESLEAQLTSLGKTDDAASVATRQRLETELAELRPRVAEMRSKLESRRGAVAAVRKAQSQHYRNIAAMSRDEKIRAGAYVYFTFLRPFAEEAGVADELDWTVPRDLPGPAYELFSAIEKHTTAWAHRGTQG